MAKKKPQKSKRPKNAKKHAAFDLINDAQEQLVILQAKAKAIEGLFAGLGPDPDIQSDEFLGLGVFFEEFAARAKAASEKLEMVWNTVK